MRLLKRIALALASIAAATAAFADGLVYPPNFSQFNINYYPVQILDVGDSWAYGTGAYNPAAESAFGLIAKSVPNQIPWLHASQPGTTADQINYEALLNFSPYPQAPSVSLVDGGINDSNCGTTAACVTNFSEEMSSTDAWLSIPFSNRQMASTATSSGTWTNDYSYVFPGSGNYQELRIAYPGTAVYATNTGNTLTFSVPSSASTWIGITAEIANSQTGTYHVSIDGTLVTDACSGTTTFTAAPCGGLSLNQYGGTSVRQQFAVTANQTHTVVITTTNAAKVSILCVDWGRPASGTPNVNTVFVVGPGPVSLFPNAATYNSASKAVVAALATGNLPVFFVDLENGSPGVNGTTDVSTSATSTCSASQAVGHPNSTCGYLHYAQTIYNEELASGYIFSLAPTAPNNSAYVPYIMTNPSIDLTAQSAAISGAALFTAPTLGEYCFEYSSAVSTPATVSSILGGTTGFSINFFDGADYVVRTITLPELNQSGSALTVSSGNTTNTTAATLSGRTCAYINYGDPVTYSFGYTSAGATAMQYQLHVRAYRAN